MGKQNNDMPRNTFENNILDLEKKYFDIIHTIIQSKSFTDDLLLIEKEIRENYSEFRDIWNLKNKIKVPAERLIRHHFYMHMHKEIKGIYPSPVSSDVGIRLNDAVVCLDTKTLDTIGNSGDIKSTHVEKNQTSFNNKNYPYILMPSNLKSIDHYSRLPVLTYVLKIIYTDDSYSFKLSRESHSSLVLVCIPNGEISKLFDFNIIDNVKTYDYFTTKDDAKYESVVIPKTLKDKALIEQFMDDECVQKRGYIKISVQGNKIAYYDTINQTLWWKTSEGNKPVIRAVKSGSSVRYNNDILKERYDSQNSPWNGYIETKLPNPLP